MKFSCHLLCSLCTPTQLSCILYLSRLSSQASLLSLEPYLLKCLPDLPVYQIGILLYSSFMTPHSSHAFQETLAFMLSTRFKDIQFINLMDFYQIIVDSTSSAHPQNPRQQPKRFIGENPKRMLLTAVGENTPTIIQLLQSQASLTATNFMTILSFYRLNPSLINNDVLELLTLKLVKSSQLSNDHEFVAIYFSLADLDIVSTAMADHFNKRFYELVDKEMAKTKKRGVLGGTVTESEGLTSIKTQLSERTDEAKAPTENPFYKTVEWVWAFFKFSFRSGELRFVDKRLLNLMLKVITSSVRSF